LFYLNKFFVFFILLKHKYLIIHIFFIKNIPINYPSLSKKDAKLSKNCPNGLKKSRKILKKSEKITFFHFFPYGLIAVFIKYRITILRKKNVKKMYKKKSEKKGFRFYKLFF
jgi:hypothetical protein